MGSHVLAPLGERKLLQSLSPITTTTPIRSTLPPFTRPYIDDDGVDNDDELMYDDDYY